MQFCFIWKDQHYTFTVPPQGYIIFLTPCHNLVQMGLDLLHYTRMDNTEYLWYHADLT